MMTAMLKTFEDGISDHGDSNVEDIDSDEAMKGYNDTNDDDSIDEEVGDGTDDDEGNDSAIDNGDKIYDKSLDEKPTFNDILIKHQY